MLESGYSAAAGNGMRGPGGDVRAEVRNEAVATPSAGWLARYPFARWVVLGVLLGTALGIRVVHFDQAHSLGERQYRSAVIARHYYYQATDAVPEWRKAVTATSRERMGTLEPPLTERVVAALYRLAGGERLVLARWLTSLLWVAGGAWLYLLARRLASDEAALVATGYYLFAPAGVSFSIVFIPDALMMSLFVAGVWLIYRELARPRTSSLLLAAFVAGMAIVVKPVCLFALVGAIGLPACLRVYPVRRAIAMVALCLAPTGLYYLYGALFGDDIGGQLSVSFAPRLWLGADYWKRWLLTAAAATGAIPLVLGLLGWPLLRDRLSRAVVGGLWIGYVGFCLFFSYHIRFATHYHAQLLVVIALSAAPLVDLLGLRLRQTRLPGRATSIVALALAAWLTHHAVARDVASHAPGESPELAREIGELVGHSERTLYVASYYGAPLEYYAELAGWYWPRRYETRFSGYDLWAPLRDRDPGSDGFSVAERLQVLPFTPEYFVITDFREFRRHDDLRRFLDERCTKLHDDDRYLAYACDLERRSK